MTSRSSVAPGTMVIRPSNWASLPTLVSRHTATTSCSRSSACWTRYFPSFPDAPTMQILMPRFPSWILRWPPQPNEARRAAFQTTRGYRISWPRRAANPDDRRESVQAPTLATASKANAEPDGRKRDPPNEQHSVVLGHAMLVVGRVVIG